MLGDCCIVNTNCSDTVSLCFVSLPDPFVTSEIRIHPISWSNAAAFQVAVHGQRYQDFNHSNLYVGCLADWERSFDLFWISMDQELCITSCKASGYPFASQDENGTCWCGSPRVLAFVADEVCPQSSESRRKNETFVALMRTYDIQCKPPNPESVKNGNLTAVQMYSNSEVYAYLTSVNYTCDAGYELADGSTLQTSICKQNKMWTEVSNCSIISCAQFSVENGNVSVVSLEYEGVATVECDRGFWAENGNEVMKVTCESNKMWTTQPTCKPGNLLWKEKYFVMSEGKLRDAATAVTEVPAQGHIDCAVKCTDNFYCTSANYQPPTYNGDSAGTCRLFLEHSDGYDVTSDDEWDYLDAQ